MTKESVTSFFFPEVKVSGYTSIDGTVEFYSRVKSLLSKEMVVLDYGAGRSAWFFDDSCEYRKQVRLIQGHVKTVIGCDVDKAILKNESVDEKLLVGVGERIPLENNSVDLIVSDYTFEHLIDPEQVTKEFDRVLKPGGWVCARTPNKYSYMAVITRLIKNDLHPLLLKYLQPDRKEIDVFPTAYKLNSIKQTNKYFDSKYYSNYSYRFEAEPAYHLDSRLVFGAMLIINKLLPSIFKSNVFIFLKKIE